ncbi:hypothetical protein RHMOL_Rhmol04G0198500 [Rhododendron molle]|uniref:Uncharacterized protein n=1 Tax=Rhododendron molle TaxID=49168 RepID=A0ACC0P3Y7_RHOML|nr:hypothetical protein RHMOL_Rhmol04G0198500 [Rhododendron molle]
MTRENDRTEQSTVRGPAYNTAHKGRPTDREEQSGRHIPSFTEASTSSSRVESRRRGRGTGVRKTQTTFSIYLELISITFLTLMMSKVTVIVDLGR